MGSNNYELSPHQSTVNSQHLMNYLAHLYLADNTPESRLGNFLGDFVKGNAINLYSDGIKQGIQLHRKIDAFTDSHQLFKQSKQLISSENKRYSGILIDIFYDYFLAKNWLIYSKTPLNQFATEVYQLLDENAHILPQRLQLALPHIKSSNWLTSYASIEGITVTLKRVGLRLKRENCLVAAIEDLSINYEQLEFYFSKFFPELITYAQILIHEQK